LSRRENNCWRMIELSFSEYPTALAREDFK
jgi:hypothetical protein